MAATCLNLESVGYKIHVTEREVAIGKVAARLCLTLIVKELKISVEHGRVVATLNKLNTKYPFKCNSEHDI